MSHEEQVVRYDLRTKLLQQAVTTFAAAVTYLQNPSSGEFKSSLQARIKAITMLLVINCLIENTDETLYRSNGCSRSSFVTLLGRGKYKFVRHIASVVKLTSQQPKPTTEKEVVH